MLHEACCALEYKGLVNRTKLLLSLLGSLVILVASFGPVAVFLYYTTLPSNAADLLLIHYIPDPLDQYTHLQ